MKLKQNDWHYNSVLYAKRQAIWHAAELIKKVKKNIEDNQQQMAPEVFQEAMNAIEQFKDHLKIVNGPTHGYLSLNKASNSFFKAVENSALSEFVTLEVSSQSATFRQHLAKQDSAETLSSRRQNFLIKTFIHSLTPALIALYAASWIFTPLLAMFLLFTWIAPFIIACALALSINELGMHRVPERDIIDEGIAIDNLYQLLVDDVKPSAPPSEIPVAEAQVVDNFHTTFAKAI